MRQREEERKISALALLVARNANSVKKARRVQATANKRKLHGKSEKKMYDLINNYKKRTNREFFYFHRKNFSCGSSIHGI